MGGTLLDLEKASVTHCYEESPLLATSTERKHSENIIEHVELSCAL